MVQSKKLLSLLRRLVRLARGPPVCLAHCSTAATLDGLRRFPASVVKPRLTSVTSSRRYRAACCDAIAPRDAPELRPIPPPPRSSRGSGSLKLWKKQGYDYVVIDSWSLVISIFSSKRSLRKDTGLVVMNIETD